MGPKRKLKVSQPNKKTLAIRALLLLATSLSATSNSFSASPMAFLMSSMVMITTSSSWITSSPRWASVVLGATATAGQIARLSCGTAESEQTHTHTPCLLLREGAHEPTFLNIFSNILRLQYVMDNIFYKYYYDRL